MERFVVTYAQSVFSSLEKNIKLKKPAEIFIFTLRTLFSVADLLYIYQLILIQSYSLLLNMNTAGHFHMEEFPFY